MPEVKNAFLKSKMNKDLDDRLIPSGEYRNAINAQINNSEDSDAGTLQNVLGNALKYTFESGVANLTSIGYYASEVDNSIYVFLTDNYDQAGLYTPTGAGSNHFIYEYSIDNSGNTNIYKLIEGPFLNFSANSPIFGVNIVENLLFWTDNRNQPRKINIDRARENENYYTTEDQISVAKYNPYRAIELYQESTEAPGEYETTLKDVVSKFLPDGGTADVNGDVVASSAVVVDNVNMPFYPNDITNGMTVGVLDATNTFTDLGVTVNSYSAPNLTLSGNVTLADDDQLIFNFNPYYNPTYSGDSDFLNDKFVRFSYRFKFDDNEYSILAPFTQECFIPKQDGYFLNTSELESDQIETFESSIVKFMENKINSIDLVIPLPFAANTLASNLKITELDILYKESDGLSMQVVETISINDIVTAAGSNTEYVYNYINKKPYKTLPEKELIRVYDKVPVKAFAQEISGNRVIYGNYQDKHTTPPGFNYNVAPFEKLDFNNNIASATQDGALVDSTTINLTSVVGTINQGVKITGTGIPDNTFVVSIVGTQIVVSQDVTSIAGASFAFSSFAPEQNYVTKTEYPSSTLKTNRTYQLGVVLADKYGRQSSVIFSNNKESTTILSGATYITYTGDTVYSPYIDAGVEQQEWSGNALRVLFNDVISPQSILYNSDTTDPNYNPLGWYSYKIVIKQTEQEYYNVYTAGALKGDPTAAATPPDQEMSYISLINDNINKVPRDLKEVGPQDKSFRSSVKLYGRVVNTDTSSSPSYNYSNTGNQQYYPGKNSFTAVNIQELYDIFNYNNITFPIPDTANVTLFYNYGANPLIAEISTSQITASQFGQQTVPATPYFTIENLAVFETEPVVSRLDIYWETSTAGLISDLNHTINTAPDQSSSVSFTSFNTNALDENLAAGQDILTTDFRLQDFFGDIVPTANINSLTLNSVFDDQLTTNDRGPGGDNWFELYQPSADFWNIRVTSNFVNGAWFSAINGANTFTFNFTAVVTEPGKSPSTTIIQDVGVLGNICPIIYEDDGVTDVTNGSITLPQTPPIQNELITVKAKNGANDPNSEKDLSWAIKSAVDSNGNAVPFGGAQNSYFSITQTEDGNYKNCKLYNNKYQTSNLIPVDTYTVVLEVEDAEPCIKEVTIIVQIGTQPNQIRFKYWDKNPAYTSGSAQGMQIHITDSGSLNGYYFWGGTEEEWETYLEDVNGIVEIENTDARKIGDPDNEKCTTSRWKYATTEAGIVTLIELCNAPYPVGNLNYTEMQSFWEFYGNTTSFGYRIIEIDQVGSPLLNGTSIRLEPSTNSTIGLPDVGANNQIAPAKYWYVTGDGIPDNTRIENISIAGGDWQITLNNQVTSVSGARLILSFYVGTQTSGAGVTRTISYYIT
jgi:hypothetical protein